MADAMARLLPVLQFRDRDRVAPYGLTAGQWYALRAVTDASGLTVNELAGSLYVDKSTASRIASGLVDRELLAQVAHADDARSVRLVVTHAGRTLGSVVRADEERDYATLLGDLEPTVRGEVPTAILVLAECAAASVETGGGSCWVVK
jgi:DNA-binding MarR family transcriptional regulator